MTRLTDWTGISVIKPHAHVKITRPNHKHFGRTGTIVRWDDRGRVWIALGGGQVIRASSRSVEVL